MIQTPEQKESDKHALNLGRLVANLQSLEFVLRGFLTNDEISLGRVASQSININEMNEGDIVAESPFTNYDSLSQLIDKYNSNVKVISSSLTIDKTLIEIRDAIAHGRASGVSPSSTLRLLKFNHPKNKQVKVTYSVSMTREWFGEQIRRVYEAILRVSEANEKLQNGTL